MFSLNHDSRHLQQLVTMPTVTLDASDHKLQSLTVFRTGNAEIVRSFELSLKVRNMALLERHARPGVAPTRGDYWFVLGSIAAVVVIALVPLLILAWLLTRFSLV